MKSGRGGDPFFPWPNMFFWMIGFPIFKFGAPMENELLGVALQVSTDPYAHVTALNTKRWKSWDISSPSFMWMAT